VGSKTSARDFFVTVASGIFIGAVAFDIASEVIKQLGVASGFIFISVGLIGWLILKILVDRLSRSGLAIVSALAFWFHSFLEGAVTALSFAVGIVTGLIVAAGMLLHLVPEFFAITAILKGEGVSTKRSASVDFIGIAILFVSFGLINFILHGLSAVILNQLAAVSGGAFLYIGAASFLKRPKTSLNFAGLLLGLAAAALWNLAF
jgi:zinc transporter ZupT